MHLEGSSGSKEPSTYPTPRLARTVQAFSLLRHDRVEESRRHRVRRHGVVEVRSRAVLDGNQASCSQVERLKTVTTPNGGRFQVQPTNETIPGGSGRLRDAFVPNPYKRTPFRGYAVSAGAQPSGGLQGRVSMLAIHQERFPSTLPKMSPVLAFARNVSSGSAERIPPERVLSDSLIGPYRDFSKG